MTSAKDVSAGEPTVVVEPVKWSFFRRVESRAARNIWLCLVAYYVYEALSYTQYVRNEEKFEYLEKYITFDLNASVFGYDLQMEKVDSRCELCTTWAVFYVRNLVYGLVYIVCINVVEMVLANVVVGLPDPTVTIRSTWLQVAHDWTYRLLIMAPISWSMQAHLYGTWSVVTSLLYSLPFALVILLQRSMPNWSRSNFVRLCWVVFGLSLRSTKLVKGAIGDYVSIEAADDLSFVGMVLICYKLLQVDMSDFPRTVHTLQYVSFTISKVEDEQPKGLQDDLGELVSYVTYWPIMAITIMPFSNWRDALIVREESSTMKRTWISLIWTPIKFTIYAILGLWLCSTALPCGVFYVIDLLPPVSRPVLIGMLATHSMMFHVSVYQLNNQLTRQLCYTIMFGYGGWLGRLDGIPNVPVGAICLMKVAKFSNIWRYFDRGLYLFFTKHLFKPMVVKYGVLPAMCSVYGLVLSWHGFSHNNIMWIGLSFACTLIERLVALHLPDTHADQWSFVRRCLQPISIMPVAALSYCSSAYFFGSNDGETGAYFVQRFVSSAVANPWSYPWLAVMGSLYALARCDLECSIKYKMPV